MDKSDIKNGMHVITKNGDEWVILSNIYAEKQGINTAYSIMSLIGNNGWMNFDRYTNELRYSDGNDDYDIQVVFKPKYYNNILGSVYDSNDFIKLWERPIIRKMTKAEIEKELGYEIEIVESENK